MSTQIIAFIIGAITTARIGRLLAHDHLPFIENLRNKIEPTGYGLIAHCHMCNTFWIAAINTLTYHFWGHTHGWWYTNIVFAGSYVAAYVVTYDEPHTP